MLMMKNCFGLAVIALTLINISGVAVHADERRDYCPDMTRDAERRYDELVRQGNRSYLHGPVDGLRLGMGFFAMRITKEYGQFLPYRKITPFLKIKSFSKVVNEELIEKEHLEFAVAMRAEWTQYEFPISVTEKGVLRSCHWSCPRLNEHFLG